MLKILGDIPPYLLIALSALGSLMLFLYLYLQEKYKTLACFLILLLLSTCLIYVMEVDPSRSFKMKTELQKELSHIEEMFNQLDVYVQMTIAKHKINVP